MTEIVTLSNGNKVEAGCWLGGWHGWTNSYGVVDIATSHGMELDADDTAIVDWYRQSGESDMDASDETLNKLEAMTGQGGITDKATDYLENLLPEGWVLRWDDGLTLLPAWEDCAAEGNGCEVVENYKERTTHVEPCINHRPECKIRVAPVKLGDHSATYAVMLWDETGEILLSSQDVTFTPPPGFGLTGEFWFPEVIPDPKIRKAAEKLLKARRCEGHVDDDVTLLSGVGIGESRYCDGSCQS